MRVLLLSDRVIGWNSFQAAGETVEVGEDEGQRMVAAGQAEAVYETAAVAHAPAETMTNDPTRPRRRPRS